MCDTTQDMPKLNFAAEVLYSWGENVERMRKLRHPSNILQGAERRRHRKIALLLLWTLDPPGNPQMLDLEKANPERSGMPRPARATWVPNTRTQPHAVLSSARTETGVAQADMHRVLSPLCPMSTPATPRPRPRPYHRRAPPHPHQFVPLLAATPAFARLAHSTSTFKLALDALLPVLDSPTPAEVHGVSLGKNLILNFTQNRCSSSPSGGRAPNDPLVWVFWKILKSDGDDVHFLASHFSSTLPSFLLSSLPRALTYPKPQTKT
ncbi:hypothetical protein FB451DRAFT_1171540 [Mycena latifolia]|nr:hypothetical protein FB451DRAFT_1171540 [Mycena latifolia]